MARPTITDLAALSDDDLKGLSRDVADELHRREDVARLPLAIEELTQRFVDQGGPKDRLKPPAAYEKRPPHAGGPTTPEGVPINPPRGKPQVTDPTA